MISTIVSRKLKLNLIDGWDPPSGMSQPNGYLQYKINASVILTVARINDVVVDGNSGGGGRTELDSCANMCVPGKHCCILSELGRNVDVGALTESDRGLNKVPIVDAMLAYNYKRLKQVYLLVLRNVLYIDSMEDNLTTPFIFREAGLTVNERAKIYSDDFTKDDHTIQ